MRARSRSRVSTHVAQIASSPIEREYITRVRRRNLRSVLRILPTVQISIVCAFDGSDVVDLTDDTRAGVCVWDVAHVEFSVDGHLPNEAMGRHEG